jgi:cell division GTPase FtsZ
MFARRRISKKPVGIGVIATGSGGMSIASRLNINDLFLYLLHSSQDQVIHASDEARKWSNAVAEYIIGCEWDEKRRWVPLIEGAGKGAGKAVERGRALWSVCREKVLDDIVSYINEYEKAFGTSLNLLAFIDTLGGGTGTAVFDLPSLLEERLKRAYNSGEIDSLPAVIGIYTYPGSFEARKYRMMAMDALRAVEANVKSAMIFDIDRFWSGGDANESYIFDSVARRISRVIADFITLFENPELYIEAADVYDVTRPMNPPFGVIAEFNPSRFSASDIRRNASAYPTREEGEKIAFVGIMRNLDVLEKREIVDLVEKEFNATMITHVVNLNRDNGVFVLGHFRLRDLISA